MHRSNQPAEADVGHQVLNRGIGLCNSRLVIEGHREPSRELNQEANQSDAAQAIKNVDVGRHVFRADVISNVLNFQTFLEPVVNRG